MRKILVAYATHSGSTADVAELVREGLSFKSLAVECKPISEVNSLSDYDGVVVGGPMILGWHRQARRFLRAHQAELAGKPLACFLTAMSLTETRERSVDGVPIQVDPGLAKPPRKPEFISLKEYYALPLNYVRPILKAAGRIRPLRIGLFGGYLNLFALNWLERLFVLLAIQAKPGSLQNKSFILQWASETRQVFIKNWLG